MKASSIAVLYGEITLCSIVPALAMAPAESENSRRIMLLALASDHAGYRYKAVVAERLAALGHQIRDFGTNSEAPVDYPDFIRPAAEAVARGECERGIIFGGSGNGEAMAANRLPGVRCAVCWNEESARLSRAHNDANMLSIGERLVSEERMLAIVATWLATPFEGGRHLRRIQKLDP
jgi:ribose 5-phosphate isomerase B